MAQITEWEFTADIAGRIKVILSQHPELPFGDVRAEARGRGSTKRRDLSLLDRAGKVILTGEVKMPDSPEGHTPFQQTVVEDAHQKADAVGVAHNFTWNVNRLVLWNTYERDKPIADRALEHFVVLSSPIHASDEVLHPRVLVEIDKFLLTFLERFAALLSGEQPMLLMPLDEKFTLVYEASLERPVSQTLAKISEMYGTNRAFTKNLDKWMRDEQEWLLSADEAVIRENLERSAKFSCYVLANKIVFYKALRRRFSKMRQLRIPQSIASGAELEQFLLALFEQALDTTGDYETVFRGDFGDTLPFLHQDAAESWRILSEQTDGFDFTQIGHEVIGQIFDRLLSPAERHKFGQHYTRTEVVDLINVFCIRNPNARVLDPACGGGTFLVRAYARKSALSGKTLHHQDLIGQLYGFDISAYPVHLTTINLVTRDLIDEANYPLVARRDFFKVRRGDMPFSVPFKDGRKQLTFEPIGLVDAIVGNPPYVRQEKINQYYGDVYKRFLQDDIAKKEAPGANLSGRSDIHVYFFPHAATFLEQGGYMGLLTSSSWLDTSYGFRLQKYLLDNFEIIAIFESAVEPWFTGARVTTAAIILRRTIDEGVRNANTVRFIKIRRELSDILAGIDGEDARREFFEEIREHVENTFSDEVTDNWRIRTINQGELYRLGLQIFETGIDDDSEDDELGESPTAVPYEQQNQAAPEYLGYKWGIFLHAPDIFFSLTKRVGNALVPLGTLARIRYGIKSGADDFFYPQDITEQELARIPNAREFKGTYGVRPSETDRVRIVRAGDGSVHLVEAKYLEPEVHSIMGLASARIDPRKLGHQALLMKLPKSALRGQHVLKYIEWGEREGYSETKTVKDRSTSGRLWYDIVPAERSPVLWSKSHQYRHIAFMNSDKLVANCRMYDLFPESGIRADLLCAILNSTIVALTKSLFGRYVGREGALDTEVSDTNMMLVPNPALATPEIARRLRSALSALQRRDALPLVDVDRQDDLLSGELALPDRHELDDAVLMLLGIENQEDRTVIRLALYSAMTGIYREIRDTEKIMQQFRNATARRGQVTAQSLAAEIWDGWATHPLATSLMGFVPTSAQMEELELPAGRASAVYMDMFNPNSLRFGKEYITLGSRDRVDFALVLSDAGVTGRVKLPVNVADCADALKEYREQQNTLAEMFEAAAASYTSDEQMQQKIVKELWHKAWNQGT